MTVSLRASCAQNDLAKLESAETTHASRAPLLGRHFCVSREQGAGAGHQAPSRQKPTHERGALGGASSPRWSGLPRTCPGQRGAIFVSPSTRYSVSFSHSLSDSDDRACSEEPQDTFESFELSIVQSLPDAPKLLKDILSASYKDSKVNSSKVSRLVSATLEIQRNLKSTLELDAARDSRLALAPRRAQEVGVSAPHRDDGAAEIDGRVVERRDPAAAAALHRARGRGAGVVHDGRVQLARVW